MVKYRIISADSHFVEPPTMWAERINQKFRDRAMWSLDYPHTAAIWPKSQEFVKEMFGGPAEEGRRKIVHDTAAPYMDHRLICPLERRTIITKEGRYDTQKFFSHRAQCAGF
jgi:hypothetical protein